MKTLDAFFAAIGRGFLLFLVAVGVILCGALFLKFFGLILLRFIFA